MTARPSGPSERRREDRTFYSACMAFHDFLVDFSLALPSTFVGIAEGPHPTFKHANGEEGRIDFVGIPQRWLASDTRAGTTQEVDLATEKDDHFMVVVEVKIRERCGVPTFRRKP